MTSQQKFKDTAKMMRDIKEKGQKQSQELEYLQHVRSNDYSNSLDLKAQLLRNRYALAEESEKLKRNIDAFSKKGGPE